MVQVNSIGQTLKEKKEMAPRDAFGLALVDQGQKEKDLVVLDGDLSASTRTKWFADKVPERFFNIGIAEQDMISIAAGMATCGKIPVVVTYATFLIGRGLDQIRNMVAYGKLNVKLIGSHVGLATGEDGATHQALEDIAIMRSIPGMVIISPSDAVETIKAFEFAIKIKNPVYLRISREKDIIFHTEEYHFVLDKAEVLTRNQNSQVAIFATGAMVSRSLQTGKILEKKGIISTIINVHTIKPIDKTTIITLTKETEVFVTVEDHNIIGGLGTTIADVLSEFKNSVVLLKIGVNDSYGDSGSVQDLYEKYGLTPEKIAIKIESFVKNLKTVK